MNIPDEAVEAALAAQLSFKNQRGMDNSANLMRHILEAAAPHLLPEAAEVASFIAVEFERENETSGEIITRWQNAEAAAGKIVNNEGKK